MFFIITSINILSKKQLNKFLSYFKQNLKQNKIKEFLKVFPKKEYYFFWLFLIAFFASGAYLAVNYYYSHTEEVPDYQGKYIEALVGKPRYINPILCQTNDVDSDLSQLVYSGLMKLNYEGKLVNDLAEKYEISEDQLSYVFYLKKGVRWHSGGELSADDVIFTIQTIQNPDFNSPLRINWKGVRVEKVDDHTVKFILKNAYSPFLNNLTFGILPKHLWEFIDANNFLLAQYNFKPIGSGPFKFQNFVKNEKGEIDLIKLEANEDYYFKKPYLENITFKFYPSEEKALSAFNRKEVMGINYLSPKNQEKIASETNTNIYHLRIPRYFAVFFNQTKSKALSDKTVRLALSHAIDKNELIGKVFFGQGEIIDTPIPPSLLGYNPNAKIYDFAPEHANNILEAAGWIKNEEGVRTKDEVKLEFVLTTTKWPELSETAEILKKQWEEIGARVEVKILEAGEIQQDHIRPREYEALLFGEVLNYDPDPFAFWHSSQKKDPGLNLALYDNSEVDTLLEEARKTADQNTRVEKYQKFQELLIDDAPAIFLYSPHYLYVHNRSVRGAELDNIIIPSNRFNGIEDWFVKTKRVWK